MPVLDANLAAAHIEYMAGDIPAGAFHYVRTRHLTACAVLASDDLEAEDAYKACALLAIDLRTGIEELTGIVKDKVDAWWQCYRDAGFTDLHPFFFRSALRSPDLH